MGESAGKPGGTYPRPRRRAALFWSAAVLAAYFAYARQPSPVPLQTGVGVRSVRIVSEKRDCTT